MTKKVFKYGESQSSLNDSPAPPPSLSVTEVLNLVCILWKSTLFSSRIISSILAENSKGIYINIRWDPLFIFVEPISAMEPW
jgi:hypothetical protein